MWYNNLIGTHSLFVSKRNYASSWEPVGDQTHMDSALTDLMMWKRQLNTYNTV